MTIKHRSLVVNLKLFLMMLRLHTYICTFSLTLHTYVCIFSLTYTVPENLKAFSSVFSFFFGGSFEGEISSKNIEIGKIGADKVFRYHVSSNQEILLPLLMFKQNVDTQIDFLGLM